MPTEYSILAGRDVDTASEEWRHECECMTVIAMPDRAHRIRYLYGVVAKWSDGRDKVEQRGVKHIRGEAAARRIQDDCMRIHEARKANTAPAGCRQPE